jgi:hypothetical protein
MPQLPRPEDFVAKAEAARPILMSVPPPAEQQTITVNIPKRVVKDKFTGIVYTEIGVSVNYNTEMEVGVEYLVRVNAFRGKVTTIVSKGTTNTTFNVLAARKVAIFLEGDAFKIIPKSSQSFQTLLPENYSIYWEFSVTPIVSGLHNLIIKIGTSDTSELSFSRTEERPVAVKSSVRVVQVKANQLKEHYIRNQVIYNSLGGCLVFLSGFIAVKRNGNANVYIHNKT